MRSVTNLNRKAVKAYHDGQVSSQFHRRSSLGLSFAPTAPEPEDAVGL